MTRIVNHFPNPRMRGIDSMLSYHGCAMDSYTSTYEPSSSRYPGLTLRATRDGDNWADMNIPLPAGARLVAACNSNGDVTSNGAAMSIWTSDGATWMANNTHGWLNASGEFTVPSNGQVKVTFRCSRTNGERFSVFNVFVGTLEDWQALTQIVKQGFLSWDLMPLNRS
ncbi:hypothetical protein [Bifidobacterium phasiani]|uniref:Uncharacterized protein n=1 Tax=Bifidobacterium phasiani TaxID=2834431 RepID=A0ABS6W686_9BIFI|nr:hypothetical protein [Bifidobacterium phasiani]MBW3081957.1 hypothetical protein [Bifidobacterium phasiani]